MQSLFSLLSVYMVLLSYVSTPLHVCDWVLCESLYISKYSVGLWYDYNVMYIHAICTNTQGNFVCMYFNYFLHTAYWLWNYMHTHTCIELLLLCILVYTSWGNTKLEEESRPLQLHVHASHKFIFYAEDVIIITLQFLSLNQVLYWLPDIQQLHLHCSIANACARMLRNHFGCVYSCSVVLAVRSPSIRPQWLKASFTL